MLEKGTVLILKFHDTRVPIKVVDIEFDNGVAQKYGVRQVVGENKTYYGDLLAILKVIQRPNSTEELLYNAQLPKELALIKKIGEAMTA